MKNSMQVKKKKNFELFDIILLTFFTLLAIITIYPFYNVIIISLATTKSLVQHTPYLLPYVFDLTGYKTVLGDSSFFSAFFVSMTVTIVGTSLNMILSVSGAYVLSKKNLVGRKFFLGMIIFTMLFGGGLIPTYLVMKDYNLLNTLWIMILPAVISPYYLIIMKNYFMELPESLLEAAKIDGANEMTVLIKIVLPISLPFMATFTLFYAVERWNEWWNALIYINESNLKPLQIYLRDILLSFNMQLTTQAQDMIGASTKVNVQSIQMAAIIIATLPILCIYPFVQKHFTKGIMSGAVKE